MQFEIRTITPEELVNFRKERSEGARYMAKAKIQHPPSYSGMLVGPSMSEDEFHDVIPVPALRKYLRRIKKDEEGVLVDAVYEGERIKFLRINWRDTIQIHYSNPAIIPNRNFGKSVRLEDMFEIIKTKCS